MVEIAETAKITKTIKTAGVDKNGKESKSDENPRSNLARVPYIRYLITFQK